MSRDNLRREQAPDREVEALIAHHLMSVLPVEGTLFARTYEEHDDVGGLRCSAMIGLYSINPVSRSLFHRLRQTEIWHFYGGDPIRLILLKPDGSDQIVILGPSYASGHLVQLVIPGGVWQAGELIGGGRWALFGCTLAPGFVGRDFEAGDAEMLLEHYPGRRAEIEQLCPDKGSSPMPADFR